MYTHTQRHTHTYKVQRLTSSFSSAWKTGVSWWWLNMWEMVLKGPIPSFFPPAPSWTGAMVGREGTDTSQVTKGLAF